MTSRNHERAGQSRLEVLSFANETALATSVATAWLDEVASADSVAARRSVALSGGRIARQFFAAVVELARAKAIDLGAIDFFWGDERCVPPDHAESNFGVAAKLLLEPLGIAPGRIHRIRGELSPDAAAHAAEAELLKYAAQTKAGQPVLDWVFLGMGEDGHVASLFPGEPAEVMASPAIYRSVFATKPPPQRITLGYATIAAAREVWVLASGAGKETALRESLTAGGTTPLARVIALRERTRIFTDLLRM
ncbi:6-phosphogluconolactonase [Verrucomicrobiota bacterium]|nr:6-phosphogluconolactonase [Verrucomicrobiota bacterium]